MLAVILSLHPVWNLWTKANCDVLERVQMRAVSFVSGLKGSTYEENSRSLIYKHLRIEEREQT